jgi:hypothetical protein
MRGDQIFTLTSILSQRARRRKSTRCPHYDARKNKTKKQGEKTMKQKSFYTGLIILMLLVVAAIPARAQTVANGPYYATPSWDQTLPVATRFIVLSNMGGNAVLDRETGLVWEKSPSTASFTFSNGNLECQQRKTGGRMGWRLPLTAELFSLLDPAQISLGSAQAALPPGHPFLNTGGFTAFWVIDRGAPPFNNNANIDGVFLGGALINVFDASSPGTAASLRVWCVRGPGGSPIPW